MQAKKTKKVVAKKLVEWQKKNKSAHAKALREANFKRWRKQRGVKMIMSIVPFGKKGVKRAICLFEGHSYVGLGKTHTEALNKCIEAIINSKIL